MFTEEISIQELQKIVSKMHDYEKFNYYIDYIINLAFEKFSETELDYNLKTGKAGIKFVYLISLKKFYDTYLGMLITLERKKMKREAARYISANITLRYNEFIQNRKLFQMQKKKESYSEDENNIKKSEGTNKKGWNKLWNLFNLKKGQKNL